MKINKLFLLPFFLTLTGCTTDNSGTNDIEEETPVYDTIDYTLEFNKGTYNTYVVQHGEMYFNSYAGSHIYEAEQGQISEAIQFENDNSFSNSTIVAYFDSGESVTFLIEADIEIKVLVTLALATGDGNTVGAPADDYLSVTLNERNYVDASDCYIHPTGGWKSFREYNIGVMTLEKGLNYVTVDSYGGINFDYMVLTPTKNIGA